MLFMEINADNSKIHKKYVNKKCEEMRVFLRLTYGGADKSLARPGRKQATATKL